MKSLTYVSNAAVPINKEELERILNSSLKNNSAADVTGMLVYHDSTFIQVLEGPEEAVDRIYGVVQHDDRHENLVVLNESQIEDREFGKWEMGFRFIEPGEDLGQFTSFQELAKILKNPDESNAKTILKTFYDLNISEDEKYAKLERTK